MITIIGILRSFPSWPRRPALNGEQVFTSIPRRLKKPQSFCVKRRWRKCSRWDQGKAKHCSEFIRLIPIRPRAVLLLFVISSRARALSRKKYQCPLLIFGISSLAIPDFLGYRDPSLRFGITEKAISALIHPAGSLPAQSPVLQHDQFQLLC